MKLTFIFMGNKMPLWVNTAVTTFIHRLQEDNTVTLLEIPLLRRSKGQDLTKILEKEKQQMSAAIPTQARVIALDVTGESFSSEMLSQKLERLQQINSHLCFLIGGPEGLASEIRDNAHERWSLSKLTLPHTLARIFILETLYRSWSILKNHPYHK